MAPVASEWVSRRVWIIATAEQSAPNSATLEPSARASLAAPRWSESMIVTPTKPAPTAPQRYGLTASPSTNTASGATISGARR